MAPGTNPWPFLPTGPEGPQAGSASGEPLLGEGSRLISGLGLSFGSVPYHSTRPSITFKSTVYTHEIINSNIEEHSSARNVLIFDFSKADPLMVSR